MRQLPLALVLLTACSAYKLGGDAKDTAGEYMTGDEDWGDDTGEPEEDDTAEPESCDDAADAAVTWYLSADDSNSQAAPVLARAEIHDRNAYLGRQRVWEWLNYHSFDYTPADAGDVRVVAQMRPSRTVEDGYDLLVAVVAPDVEPEERRPLNLTFSVDTSGSMGGDPLELVQDTIRAVAAELREGDVVSMVTWNQSTEIVLDSLEVAGPDDPDLLAAVDRLDAGGSTDLYHGLAAAYDVADRNWSPDRTNRVILLSDGGANTGPTEEDLIAEHAEDGESEGIYLVGVGASEPSGYIDTLMDTVTDLGKGAYVFVDSAEEAQRQFSGRRFLANLEVAARDVELAMTLPAGWTIERFDGEQMNTDPAVVREQHLAPNDAMLYHLVVRDCGADTSEAFTFSASWQEARGATRRETTTVATPAEMDDAEGTQIDKANAIIALADAVSQAREQQDPEAYADEVVALIEAAAAAQPADTELAELAELAAAWRRLL